MREFLIIIFVISSFAATTAKAQEYRIMSAGCNVFGNRIVETAATTPQALSKDEAKALLQRCAVMGLLYRGTEAAACYAAYAPLLPNSRHQEQALLDSISKNGSLDGIAELTAPITARKNRRKHQYEYSTQIAINMSRLRRLVVSLGLQ
ncbi:MAG: hypothetical protein ACI3X6_08685 [Alloprevotella sp.]